MYKTLWNYMEKIKRHIGYRWRLIKYSLNPNIKLGKNVKIEENVVLSTRGGGTITIGDHCTLYRNAFILTWGGDIKIGDHVGINAFTAIYGQGGTTIGNYVAIASHCTLTPVNHIYEDKTKVIGYYGITKEGITIENDVWIGTGCRILDGVTIKKGCVIGAGSVVTKSTEEYGIYVGVPVKKIKERI